MRQLLPDPFRVPIFSLLIFTSLMNAVQLTALAAPGPVPDEPAAGDEAAATDEQLAFFEAKIRPILVKHCYACHSSGAKIVQGGLRVDSRQGLIRGGDSGPAISAEAADSSLLLQALRYDGLQMPPKGQLPDSVLQDFQSWLSMGAPDPRTESAQAPAPAPAPDPESLRRHWAFQAPLASPPPATSFPVTSRLDAFIRAKLQEQQLLPAAPADARTLVRRLFLDLTGLPPTGQQVESFAGDPSDAAYEQLVQQLLASPAYGERWARVWLDVARYAEDQAHIVGEDKSLTYPNAFRYRDWVIQALNQDLSYAQFIRLQLAADLLEGPESPNLAALGLIGLGPKYYDRGQLFVMAEEWEDRVDVVGRGLLGLTVACARCHDHKFDPISTADYYGLAGVFASTRMFNRSLADKSAKDDAKPDESMHIVREGTPQDLHVFVRGDVENKGPLAPRRFLPILVQNAGNFTEGSGRKQLAEAIVDPGNPVTARVIVNRIWAAYFGRGLVGTQSNFGLLGDRPTHPELLDDLAVRFQQNGWSLKWLHREIVLSATYRQSSQAPPEVLARDPDNTWLARMPRRRLGAEGWRDSLLAVTGRLDTSTTGGPSIDPADPAQTRRTVYSRISRLDLNRYLLLYDFPDPNVTTEKRSETITPLQKLFVMNSAFMVSQAEALELRLLQAVPGADEALVPQRIDWAWRNLFGRPASAEELRLSEEFLQQADPQSRWRQYAHVLLASNELQYVD
ncbi:MAG: PSD1 and planctomycete cytochrome C domain-containing protein [Planctomycetota bacterium]